MKISKGTIVRTVLLVLTIANIILQRMGYDVINVSENEILEVVELLIEVSAIIVAFWKNNSFTDKAIKADEFLKTLKESE